MENQKNFYSVCCHTPEGWQQIHQELTADESTDSCIPSRCVTCSDIKEHSQTRACYELTDEEAENLKNHPEVKYVHLDTIKYPEIFRAPAKEIHCANRYTTASKQYRDFLTVGLTTTVDDINRSGYQLLRCTQRSDRWAGTDTTVINDRVTYTLDGTGVDVIVGDEGCWFGHPEFNNATGNGPTSYVGTNVLKNGFSNSSTSGTCDVLDLVLDAPYYLDSAWFEASPSTRLTLRWDGTTVPVESVAREWWTDASKRSASFSSAGVVASITSDYTRAYCNGSNSAMSLTGDHGTCCAALTYGRTQGWAFNANKWFVNAYGTNGTEPEVYFDMMKIFHQNKPINTTYGNKNPTVSSNSWGYRDTVHRSNSTTASPNYYFYRGTTTGVGYTAAVTNPAQTLYVPLSHGTIPEFMRYVGWYGDGYRMSGEIKANSIISAGEECTDAGVIMVYASGNANQKMVLPNHPDYNNYWATNSQGSSATLGISTHNSFGLETLNTTNRVGFPGHIGKTSSGEYPGIIVGALDDDYQANKLERKVDYSNMGNAIDIYAPADGTLAANRLYDERGDRPDTYAGLSTSLAAAITGVGTTGGYMTGNDLSNYVGINTGIKIVTNSSRVATISTIAHTLGGATGLSADTTPSIGHPSFGANDDGFWDLTIPWSINFGDLTTTSIFVNTNSYVLFGSRSSSSTFDSDINWNYNATSVDKNKIYILTSDGSAQRIYSGTQGSSPNRTFRVRYEGHTSYTGGVLGSPTIVWEMIFYENDISRIDLQMGANGRIVGTASDTDFSGTSAACPVAAGFIATILQEHRDWDWRKLKKYLKTSMLTQTTTRAFYQGNESRSANDSNWADVNSLEGGPARIIYNPQTNS